MQQVQNNPKRALILRHAIDTFARHGFRNSDVQVIADQALVGKGTVYRYFTSKEELFWSATYFVLQRLQQCLFQAVEGVDDPLESLFAAGMAHARFYEANPAYLEMFVQNRAEFRGVVPPSHKELHEQMILEFVKIVEKGVACGQIRPLDPRKTVMSLGSVFYGTVIFACFVEEEFTLTELAQNTLKKFLRGIRADQSVSE
jgi:AcrR family transcriptional regulator